MVEVRSFSVSSSAVTFRFSSGECIGENGFVWVAWLLPCWLDRNDSDEVGQSPAVRTLSNYF